MPGFKAPKTIPGASPETQRALTAAFAELERALAENRDQYVDRRTRNNTYLPQANQVVHLPNGKRQQLPDPRPYLAATITFVVERGTAELLGPVNRAANATLTGPGSFILTSTGDTWWLLGSATFGTADEVAGEPGPTGPIGPPGLQGLTGEPGAVAPPGLPGQFGLMGAPGAPGRQGDRGGQGAPGLNGQFGLTGVPGQRGDLGPVGPAGVPAMMYPGPIGLAGVRGTDGAAGAAGARGADGAPALLLRGPMGLAGIGSVGPTGPTGATGPAGSAGAGLISFVDVNLGTVPRTSGTFDITGLAGLTTGDPVLVTRGVGPGGAGEAPDEAQESVSASGVVISATSIRAYWESVNGPIAGTRRFYYAQLTGHTGDDFTAVQRADEDLDNTGGVLSVLPQFNMSRYRVAHHAEFEGAIWQAIPIEGFTPGGDMRIYPRLVGEAGHPGVLRAIVPLSRSGYLHMGGAPTSPLWDPATLLGWRMILNMRTANPGADYTAVFGVGQDISQLTGENTPSTQFGTDGIWVATTSGGVWRRVRRVASASTGNNTVVNHTAGTWFELAMMRNASGSVGELFINNVSALTISLSSLTTILNFGMGIIDNTGGTADFVVDIDSATIWTRELVRF